MCIYVCVCVCVCVCLCVRGNELIGVRMRLTFHLDGIFSDSSRPAVVAAFFFFPAAVAPLPPAFKSRIRTTATTTKETTTMATTKRKTKTMMETTSRARLRRASHREAGRLSRTAEHHPVFACCSCSPLTAAPVRQPHLAVGVLSSASPSSFRREASLRGSH